MEKRPQQPTYKSAPVWKKLLDMRELIPSDEPPFAELHPVA